MVRRGGSALGMQERLQFDASDRFESVPGGRGGTFSPCVLVLLGSLAGRVAKCFLGGSHM